MASGVYIKSDFSIKSSYLLDSQNRVIQQDDYSSYGRVQTSLSYRYDDSGNIIESKILSTGGPIKKYDTKYDNEGKLIEYNVSDGGFDRKFIFKYENEAP